ncbi:MAG: flagellar basal body rod protein FlgB [Verrucomicrobiota bacterium]|nr:flagellar basal body rod protein FlgB [Verrucomicrobiota bacterium]MCC6822525.1 flagellar basal body rod protein FlgB [Limisphaerales bacterium]
MIDALFSQTNYVAVKKMLDATALRHEAIASNLANLETPHYQRRDVNSSFATELNQAMGAKDAARIQGLQPTLALDTTAVANNRDGNTVQLETELLNLNQNTIAHTLETQLVTGQLLRLRLAITGRSA